MYGKPVTGQYHPATRFGWAAIGATHTEAITGYPATGEGTANIELYKDDALTGKENTIIKQEAALQ